jgi:hypothetical protein
MVYGFPYINRFAGEHAVTIAVLLKPAGSMPETMIVLPTAIGRNVLGTARERVAIDPLPVPAVGTNVVPEV